MDAQGRVRVGFVGAGFIAGVHGGILAREPRAVVSRVFDTDPRAASLFALTFDAEAMPSAAAVLDGVDAVYVCNPNALHAATVLEALGAGVAVFSEKPMATSVIDAQRVLDAVRASGAVYQAGFNRRFASVYAEIKRRLDEGSLSPVSAQLKMNRGELQRPPWTGDERVSGGFLYETPIHMLDLVRYLIGEPEEIEVRARQAVYGQLDDFSMLLTTASGVTITLTANAHATWQFPFERMELYGAHAQAASEEMERVTFARGLGEQVAVETLDFAQQPMEQRWGYVTEDHAFIGAVLGEGEPAVGAQDAFLTTALVDRCYRAAATAAGK